jgi:hypothetical protein
MYEEVLDLVIDTVKIRKVPSINLQEQTAYLQHQVPLQ